MCGEGKCVEVLYVIFQHKIDGYKLKDILWKPQGNHKEKTIIDNTKDKEKKNKSNHYKNSSNNKRRWQERKRGTKKLQNIKILEKIAIISPYLSIITLNINGLNFSIKKCRVAVWVVKKSPWHTVYKRITFNFRKHIG